MKIISSPLKSFPGTALATLAIAIVSGLSASTTQAGYTVTLQQDGANVVASGAGTIDWTDLSKAFDTPIAAFIDPSQAALITGPTGFVGGSLYTGFNGPTNFGNGSTTFGSSGTGDRVGIQAIDLTVPFGYVSGNPLSSTSVLGGQTFATLGVTPGTYVWTWGSGAHADSFTLQIGAVPDSGSSIVLLFLSLGALFGASRFRSPRVG